MRRSTTEEAFGDLDAVDRERHGRGQCAQARDLLGVDAVAGADDQGAVALTLPAQRKRDRPVPCVVRLRSSDRRIGGRPEQAPHRRLHHGSDLGDRSRSKRPTPAAASTAARSNAASCPCARSARREPSRNTAASEAASDTSPFDGSTPTPTSAGTAHEPASSTMSRSGVGLTWLSLSRARFVSSLSGRAKRRRTDQHREDDPSYLTGDAPREWTRVQHGPAVENISYEKREDTREDQAEGRSPSQRRRKRELHNRDQ